MKARSLMTLAVVCVMALSLTAVADQTLTVINGGGSGVYAVGAEIEISVNPAPSGLMFDQWDGDTAYLDNIDTSTATVTMPAVDITITATYKARSVTIICDPPLLGDIVGNDCFVGIEDLAQMASDWMQCNLIPAEAC